MHTIMLWMSLVILTTELVNTRANLSNAPIGFGAAATGGQGGQVISVNSAEQLKAAAESEGKKIIQVSGQISGGPQGMSIKVTSDKSIVGQGPGTSLEGIGLQLTRVNNVVIQNLKMTLKTLVNPALDSYGKESCIRVNSGILIWIFGSTNIWVDHCELYNVKPGADMSSIYHVNVGIQAGAKNMTFSWNHFHDMGRNFLVGAGDTDASQWFITIHHNYFENLQERNPLVRGGTGHVFNNYFKDISYYGVNAVVGACLRVEKNVFENVGNPIVSNHPSIKQSGAIENVQNVVSGQTKHPGFNEPQTCKAQIPYTYQADEAQAAKTAVIANAGPRQLNSGSGGALASAPATHDASAAKSINRQRRFLPKRTSV